MKQNLHNTVYVVFLHLSVSITCAELVYFVSDAILHNHSTLLSISFGQNITQEQLSLR